MKRVKRYLQTIQISLNLVYCQRYQDLPEKLLFHEDCCYFLYEKIVLLI